MHIQHHAQRKHIINALEILLYQLHVLSHLLSPSILALVTRTASQFQLSKPRDIESKRTLRFWVALILLFNFGSVWMHATRDATEHRAVILDFVGSSFRPSRWQLLNLDFTIVLLSILLTAIAYETSCQLESSQSTDALASIPMSLDGSPIVTSVSSSVSPSLVIDVRLSALVRHLRSPSPSEAARAVEDDSSLLPLPNTTVTPFSRRLRMLMQIPDEDRRHEIEAEGGIQRSGQAGEGSFEGNTGHRRLPGAIDTDFR